MAGISTHECVLADNERIGNVFLGTLGNLIKMSGAMVCLETPSTVLSRDDSKLKTNAKN